MALALVPAPPDTAALMKSIPGFLALKSAIIASRPSCSPAPVHHENTSTWSLAGSLAGSFAASLAGSFAVSLAGSLVGSLDLEQAATQIAHIRPVAKRTATWLGSCLCMEQPP